jgi:hypothetical protein
VQLTEDYNSFGPGFNSIGGGWYITAMTIFPLLSRLTFFCRYAMERTNDYIKVWFWERSDTSAPFDAISGAWSINTDNWVTVLASLIVLGIHG